MVKNINNSKMEKIEIFFVFVEKGECVAGCPSYTIYILVGECWFFLYDQHSPIIKKISILKILVSSNSPDFEY